MLKKSLYRGPGSISAAEKLRSLGFDPIEVMVRTYKEVCKEAEIQAGMRDGRIVRLKADGNPRQYVPEVHMAVIDRQIAIGEKLLRYGYARVPETNDLNIGLTPSLNITLHDTDETFILNGNQEQLGYEHDDQPSQDPD